MSAHEFDELLRSCKACGAHAETATPGACIRVDPASARPGGPVRVKNPSEVEALLEELSSDTHDPVNHPDHYCSHPSGVEAIEVCRLLPFTLGNAAKYVWRMGEKGKAAEDLRKAAWYLRDHAKNRPLQTVPPLSFKDVEKVLEYESAFNPSPLGLLLRTLMWESYGPDKLLEVARLFEMLADMGGKP